MPLSPPLSPSSSPPTPGQELERVRRRGSARRTRARRGCRCARRRDELREHHGRRAVLAGVAQVVLPRRTERRVDDELLRRRVVRRGGADRGDVRAVARLRHRERARDLDRHRVGQELVVVALGAQVEDRRREQAPLHARLDLQRRVGGDELLEPREEAAVVVGAAEPGRERRGARRPRPRAARSWSSTRSRCSASDWPSIWWNRSSATSVRAAQSQLRVVAEQLLGCRCAMSTLVTSASSAGVAGVGRSRRWGAVLVVVIGTPRGTCGVDGRGRAGRPVRPRARRRPAR